MIESDSNINTQTPRRYHIDLLLILVLSFTAEMTHFSAQKGRSVLNGDSVQYLATAEALLDAQQTPHFEVRKPGYPFFLAGLKLLTGNMFWSAVVANHLLLAMLPLLAYGLGRNLRSRTLGWLAALMTMAQLQVAVLGDRIMSESLYVVLMTSAILAFVVSIRRNHAMRWMFLTGTLVGMAWFTRGQAWATMPAFLGLLVWVNRARIRRALSLGVAMMVPVVFAIILECGLNAHYAGHFRTSSGTFGSSLLLRMRYDQGVDFVENETTERLLALLPERDARDAYQVNHLDIWVARYRAVHDFGLDEWQADDLMAQAGIDCIWADPASYIHYAARMSLQHLLRRPDGKRLLGIPESRRTQVIGHPDAPGAEPSNEDWFRYWALPNYPLNQATAMSDQMLDAAREQAPLGNGPIWRTLRYWNSFPLVDGVWTILGWLASWWPGIALLGFFVIGLPGSTCALIGLAYVLDAVLIGALIMTNARMQFIWLVTDTVLSAALFAPLIEFAIARVSMWCRRLPSFAARGRTARTAHS